MRALPLPLLLVGLLVAPGCGPTEPLPSLEAVCDGVYCTAGRCVSDRGAPMCLCGPEEHRLGLTCEVDEVGDLDRNGDWSDAVPIAVPTASSEGRLHLRDVDTFRFEVVEGHIYRFTCTPQDFLECEVRDLNFSHSETTTPVRQGRDTVVAFRASFSRPFTMQLGAWPLGNADVRGTYRYSLIEDSDDLGAELASARQVAVDGPPFSERSHYSGDIDVFAFDALADTIYNVRCTSEVPEVDAWLHRASDDRLVSADRQSTPEGLSLTVELDQSTRYMLKVRARPLASYQCTITTRGKDDHGDTAATATPVGEPPAQLTGKLETRDDVDIFAFTALAGHSYVLQCAQPDDPVCRASYISHPRRTIPPTPITVTSDQPLHVVVFGDNRSIGPARLGAYSLTVRDLGPDQGSSAQEAVALQPDTSVEGLIARDVGDEDYFRFEAEPGRVYRVAVEGVLKQVAVFRETDPTYNLLRYNLTDVGWVKTNAAETLVLRVGGSDGPYRLVLESARADDHADTWQGATLLPGPAPRAVGRLDAVEDEDWFAMDLQARDYVPTGAQSAEYHLVEADGVTPVPYNSISGMYRPRAAGRHLLRVNTSTIYFSWQPPYVFELGPR
jgi:hypothetical protein